MQQHAKSGKFGDCKEIELDEMLERYLDLQRAVQQDSVVKLVRDIVTHRVKSGYDEEYISSLLITLEETVDDLRHEFLEETQDDSEARGLIEAGDEALSIKGGRF